MPKIEFRPTFSILYVNKISSQSRGTQLNKEMNSIGKECNELKAKYDECFHVWFSEKFLKGDTNDDMCKPFFGVYRDCVRVRNC